MKPMMVVGGLLTLWLLLVVMAMAFQAIQNPAATKNRIPNPYQDKPSP